MSRISGLAGGIVATLALAVPAHAATIDVTHTDDVGEGSLRAAIEAANATVDAPDVIDASGVSGTIELQSALPQITSPVEIRGPGSAELELRREPGDSYRMFSVQLAEPGEVSISGLALIGVTGADSGGGITSANAQLSLDDVVVSGHASGGAGAGLEISSGSARVVDSTIANNQAFGFGGGVWASDTARLTMERSTVSGNSANYQGGGLSLSNNRESGHLIRNSTIVGNVARDAAAFAVGGGIAFTAFPSPLVIESTTIAGNEADIAANILSSTSSDVLRLRNSIVADPVGLENCSVEPSSSDGHNIADDATCGLDQPTDQVGVDPMLGALADNGGPTQTMMPEPGSPAIDGGSAEGLAPAVDQRGLPRRVDFLAIPNPAGGGDGSDVGPVEIQDGVQPVLKIRKVRVNKRKRNVKVRFRIKDDTARIEARCKLDKKKFRRCSSPASYKRVRPGRHKIVVRAADASGNEVRASKRFRVKKAKGKKRRRSGR